MLFAPTDVEPTRACAACRARCKSTSLLRFTRVEGRVVPDVGRVRGGRGLNLGPGRRCVERAAARQVFTRNLKAAVPEGGVDVLCKEVVAQAEKWLRDTVAGAVARGGASIVPDVEAVEPAALKLVLASVGADGAPLLAGVPHVRITHVGTASRVGAVASTLWEFTFAMAGDTTRRPKAAEACDVLERAGLAGISSQRDDHDRRSTAQMPDTSKRIGGRAG